MEAMYEREKILVFGMAAVDIVDGTNVVNVAFVNSDIIYSTFVNSNLLRSRKMLFIRWSSGKMDISTEFVQRFLR